MLESTTLSILVTDKYRIYKRYSTYKKRKNNGMESFYLPIFAKDMKRIYCILMILCSLLIVYVGAGVRIMQYCCANCETAHRVAEPEDSCCSMMQSKQEISLSSACESCITQSCSPLLFKIDLAAYPQEKATVQSVMLLSNGVLPAFSLALSVPMREVFSHTFSPPFSKGSRHYLSLYAVLRI